MDWTKFFSLTSGKEKQLAEVKPVALTQTDQKVKKDLDENEETFLGIDKKKVDTIAKIYKNIDKSEPQLLTPPDPLIFQSDIYHPGMGPVGAPIENNQSPLFADRSSIESAKVTNLNNQIGQLQSLLFNGQ